MKRCGKLAGIGLALILSGASLNTGCTSSLISYEQEISLSEQVKSKPYLALLEGLQPFSGFKMKEVGEQISRDTGIAACATSGNCLEHMKVIRKAWKSGQKIYVAGFSMGENEARVLAEQCERKGIGIEVLFLIDGTSVGTIHGIDGKVVDIRGYDPPYAFRREERYTEKNLENKSTIIKYYDVPGEHLDIPRNSREIIEFEILESLNR